MLTKFIKPSFETKQSSEVMIVSYTAMGLLAINYFNNYQHFLKLFFDRISEKKNEFIDFDMISLFIIFDSILQNNMQSENLVKEIS